MIISFPRSGSNSDKVVLKGAKQCIEGAKARFKEIIEDLVSFSNIRCVFYFCFSACMSGWDVHCIVTCVSC